MPGLRDGILGAMTLDLDALTRGGGSEAFAMRETLPALIAAEAGLTDVPSLARRLASRTVCLTMLAGSGSRWVRSLDEAANAGRPAAADPSAPRGLYPVPNRMGFGPDPLPIAGYALAAVRDLGRHALVVRGWEREIEETALVPLGYAPGSWAFVTQAAPGGKPRGHGDAAFQAMPLWREADYVAVNFGGDASSPLTALAALSALDAMARRLGETAPGLIMPVASMADPAYPIALDGQGLPRSFGHAKLTGTADRGSDGRGRTVPGLSNVGLRLYRASALEEAILAIRAAHWSKERGYEVPGNAPASDGYGGEFALDNVDAWLAAVGRARVLRVARPEELSPVKSLDDLPAFDAAVKVVCGDWRLAPSYSNSGKGFEK